MAKSYVALEYRFRWRIEVHWMLAEERDETAQQRCASTRCQATASIFIASPDQVFFHLHFHRCVYTST